MKKKLIFLFSIILFLVFMNFLSDFLIFKIQNILEEKILTTLPEGSSIKEIKLKGFTGIYADSIYVKDFCSLPKVEIKYSPLGILRRRIRKISLFSPSFLISEGKSSGGERGGVSTLFYVEEFEIIDGRIEYKGHKYSINGNGKIFSTGMNEIILDVPHLWGEIDDIPFNIEEINLSLSDRISNIDVRSIKIGDSEFEITSYIDGRIMGNGRVYMSDLQKMFGIKSKGFVDIAFAYDSIITFKGESKVLSIEDFNLPLFTFSGEKDSVSLTGEKFSGFLRFGRKFSGRINLVGFNAQKINGNYPESKVSGFVVFSYGSGDTLRINSNLSGTVLKKPLEGLTIKISKIGKRILVDSCEGFFNNGTIILTGQYLERFEGNLEIDNLDISPIAEFLHVEVSSTLNLGLAMHDKIYGAFKLMDLNYKGMSLKSVEGNINLSQGENGFAGIVSSVSKDVAFKEKKIFELGESSLEIVDGKLYIKGIFKSEKKKANMQFSLSGDTVEVDVLKFDYSGGWISLIDPFSFTYRHDFNLKDVRFLGNKGENFKINNISLSAFGIKGDLDLIGFRPEITSEFGIISHPFSGSLSSKIFIAGSLDNPVFKFKGGGKIKSEEGSIGDSLSFSLGFEGKNFSIEDLSVFENEKNSTFKGDIKPQKGSVSLEIELRKAGPWIFYPLRKHVAANTASVTGKLKIEGSFQEPLVYGYINLQGAELLVRNSGILINELKAQATFDGYEGKLKALSAYLGEGKVKANGDFKMKEKGFDINVVLRDTPITWQYINSLIDGNLLLTKNKEKIRIEGDIRLNRATITMQFKQQETKGGRRPPNLFLDLNFDANEGNVWIRNDLANIELAGKVGVNYEGGPLLVSGNLEVRQGMFYYLYKSFEVTEGKFNFNESPELNPNIDVKAITLISSREGERQKEDTVFLVVSGTMKTPEFDLYSKSSLSKAEIMTLLSLNLGWEDLTSVKSIEQSVTETAFNYWVRQTLNRRLKQEFGIDVLEMQGVSGHYEFVVGKYVTDRLFVKARTDVQSYGSSEIQAEYKLKKWGYITAEKDFLGNTRFLFNLEWRY